MEQKSVKNDMCETCPNQGSCPNCPFSRFMNKPEHSLEELQAFEEKIKNRLTLIQEEIEKKKTIK